MSVVKKQRKSRAISVKIGESFFNDLNISGILCFPKSDLKEKMKLLKFYLRLWHVSAPRKKDEKAIKSTRDNKLPRQDKREKLKNRFEKHLALDCSEFCRFNLASKNAQL